MTGAPTRTAIVTGASEGLGLALATSLARGPDGWLVVGDARDARRLRQALEPLGDRAVAVPGDVTDPVHRSALVRTAGAYGVLRLLVHNASTLGASPLPTLDRLDPGTLADILATNVVAPLALTRLALPLLAPGATVVAVTSDAAVTPYAGWGGYAASKAALEQMMAVLAVERPDLHVYAVDPGDLRTRMHQDAFPGEDIGDRPEPATVVPALLRLVGRDLPSGRYVAAELATELATRLTSGSPA